MDETAGQLTTYKIQSMLECGLVADIRSRRDLQRALVVSGEQITRHGVEAWFRRRDSNLPIPRTSLADDHLSFPIPKRRWTPILKLFGLDREDLAGTDDAFITRCAELARLRSEAPVAVGLDAETFSLVGRDAAVAALAGAVELARETFQCVLIQGPAGVGKSRLLGEVVERLSAADWVTFSGVCLEDAEVPMMSVLSMLRLGLPKLAKVDPGIPKRFEALYRNWLKENVAAERASLEITTLLYELSALQPVVIVIDDIHWADEATSRFVDFFLRHMSSQPNAQLLLICSGRPPRTLPHPFPRERLAALGTHVQLAELGRDDAARLLSQQAGQPLPESLFDFVWTRALGNPLHTLQLYAYLRSVGAVEQFTAEREQALADSTDTLGALYRARLERLPPLTQEVVQHASVIGAVFDVELLQLALEGRSTLQVFRALEQAEEEDLIRPVRDQLQFAHPQLRSLVYEGMSTARRARIHLQCADALCTLHEADQDEYWRLAYCNHLLGARSYVAKARLVAACYDAAVLARRLGAWDQVVRYADLALDAESNDLSTVQTQELEQLVATGLHQDGRHDQALTRLDTILEKSRNSDRRVFAQALNEKVRIKRNYWLYEPSDLDDVKRLEGILDELESLDPVLCCEALITLSTHYLHERDVETALSLTRRATDITDERQHYGACAKAHVAAGLVSLRLLELHQALTSFAQARNLAIAANEPNTATRALQRMTIPQLALGRIDEVEQTLLELRQSEISSLATGEDSVALSSALQVSVIKQGKEEVEACYQAAVQTMVATGYVWAGPQVSLCYAAHRAANGDLEIARSVLDDLRPGARFGDIAPLGRVARWAHLYLDLRSNRPIQERPCCEDVALLPSYDVNQLYRYALLAKLFLAFDDERGLRRVVEVLEHAFQRGAYVTIGWPMLVPEILCRAWGSLGDGGKHDFFRQTTELWLAQQPGALFRDEIEALNIL